MKATAKVRLVFFVIITLVLTLFFLFEPQLNIGTTRSLSIYQEIKQGFPLIPILSKLTVLASAIFFGLLFLVGLEDKSNKK